MADASTTALVATSAAASQVQQGAQFVEWLTSAGPHFPIPNAIAMILVAWALPAVLLCYAIFMNKLKADADAALGGRRSTDPTPPQPEPTP